MQEAVRKLSKLPAANLKLQKRGELKGGNYADIVIFDPEATMTISSKTHHSKVDYSLFEGREVTGVPITVLSRGVPVIENRILVGKRGAGQFIKRHQYQLV